MARHGTASRSRDSIKAHHSAIEVAKAIAAALREAKAAKATRDKDSADRPRESPPSTTGQSIDGAPADEHQEKSSDSTPAATTAKAGDASTPSPADGAPSGGAPVVEVGHKTRVEKRTGGSRPVLTLAQHLCASAPERAEGRARVAEGLAALLPELDVSDRARFVMFLAKVRPGSVAFVCLCMLFPHRQEQPRLLFFSGLRGAVRFRNATYLAIETDRTPSSRV